MNAKKIIVSFLLVLPLAVGVCSGAQAEKCGKCHSDSPVYKEWQTSRHANAIKTLLKAGNASQSCLKCHSSDYELARLNPWLSRKDLPTLKTAKDAVSCSSCHKHKSKEEATLIKPVEKLCITCHVLFCGG